MGLFGFGKKEQMVKVSDFFSAEDLETIRGTAQAARSRGAVVDLLGKGLIEYISNPDKEIPYSKFNKFIKIANSFREMEPSLDAILKQGIDKYKAAGK